MLRSRRILPAAIVGFSLLAFLAILARGFVTDLGIRSFGRLWPFYLNYVDFGFARRALFGTLVFPLQGLARTYGAYLPAYAALAVTGVATALAAHALLARAIRTNGWDPLLPYAVLFLSPAFLLHGGYNTGDLDLVLTLIFIASLLVRGTFALAVLTVAGMLVHEIYLVAFLPAVCAVGFIDRNSATDTISLSPREIVTLACGMLTFAALQAFSSSGSEQAYLDRLTAISPDLAAWPGWFELTSGVRENFAVSAPALLHARTWAYLALPLIYLGVATVVFCPTGARILVQLAFLAGALAPLALLPLGADYYRWISLAAANAIIMGIAIGGPRALTSWAALRPRLAMVLLLPWTLLGPIGAADVTRPFPVLQFVLGRG